MTNAEERIANPPRMGTRWKRRVRPEENIRLAEVTPFDKANPWVRAQVGDERGYGRVHPDREAVVEFVPDAGEARFVMLANATFALSKSKTAVTARRRAREARRIRLRRRREAVA